jgi:predicted XRE-type DNA-binding protein
MPLPWRAGCFLFGGVMGKKSLLERFMDKVNSDWQWTGGKNKDGYGRIREGDKTRYAHQISYELFNGPIPNGMWTLHSCDDPGCVDPEHLHIGDHAMNQKEAFERGRRTQRGENNNQATMTSEQVLEIRRLFTDGYAQKSIAILFGIRRQHVSDLVNRKKWNHI